MQPSLPLRAGAIHDPALPETLRRALLDDLDEDDLRHCRLPDWLGVDTIVARILELPADLAADQAGMAGPAVHARLLEADRRVTVLDAIVEAAYRNRDRYPDDIIVAAVEQAVAYGRDVPRALCQRLPEDRQIELTLQQPSAVWLAGDAAADRLLRRDPSGHELVGWLDRLHAAGEDHAARKVAGRICRRMMVAAADTLQIDDDAAERIITAARQRRDDVWTTTAAARRLKTVPDLPFDERLQLLHDAPDLAEAWLAGHTANDPRPGEVSRWLRDGGRHLSLTGVIDRVAVGRPLPDWVAASPWVDEFVAELPVGPRNHRDADDRMVTTAVLAEAIGTDLQAWRTAFTLIDSADEQLTYGQVAALAAAVSER